MAANCPGRSRYVKKSDLRHLHLVKVGRRLVLGADRCDKPGGERRVNVQLASCDGSVASPAPEPGEQLHQVCLAAGVRLAEQRPQLGAHGVDGDVQTLRTSFRRVALGQEFVHALFGGAEVKDIGQQVGLQLIVKQCKQDQGLLEVAVEWRVRWNRGDQQVHSLRPAQPQPPDALRAAFAAGLSHSGMQVGFVMFAVQPAESFMEGEARAVLALGGGLVAIDYPAIAIHQPERRRVLVQQQVTFGQLQLQTLDTLGHAAGRGQVRRDPVEQYLLLIIR